MTDRDVLGRLFLSALLLLGFFATLVVVIWRPFPSDNEEVVFVLVGVVATIATKVVDYWFGSSAGSARKQRTLEGALDAQPPPQRGGPSAGPPFTIPHPEE